MTSGSVKAIQEKLFRGGDDSNGPGSSDSDPRDHRLTIQIPKPTASKSEPPAGLRGLDVSDGDTIQKSYRQRLNDRLGANYQGTERHRLQQDEARLRHWKRWGPYLSDRQWVSTIYQPSCFHIHISHSRQRFERTIRKMVMLGAISLTSTRDPGLIDGAKMALAVSRIIINAFAFHSPYGMARIAC